MHVRSLGLDRQHLRQATLVVSGALLLSGMLQYAYMTQLQPVHVPHEVRSIVAPMTSASDRVEVVAGSSMSSAAYASNDNETAFESSVYEPGVFPIRAMSDHGDSPATAGDSPESGASTTGRLP
ncbi:MAG: hypothetical protein NVS2B7_37400 [Herpetosiphon sp.]